MKIQYCSDLHLEFSENLKYLEKNPLKPVGDMLVLAGDIMVLNKWLHIEYPFFDYVSDNFEETYWITGNHEFYDGFDLSAVDKPFYRAIKPNVFMVNNYTIVKEDISFFFTTLWSKLDKKYLFEVLTRVSDFYQITHGGRIIRQNEFDLMHRKSVEYLKKALNKSTANKNIVVTHHVPSCMCNPEEFNTSPINSAFTAHMDDFILEHKIDYWIYGHNHRNLGIKKIGETDLLTNQLGYVHLGESFNFNGSMIITV